MGKFVIRRTNTGIKFDLKAGNGEVIATSEVYSSEDACRKGIASVQKTAPAAAVEAQTVEGFAPAKHPKSTARASPWVRATRPKRAA